MCIPIRRAGNPGSEQPHNRLGRRGVQDEVIDDRAIHGRQPGGGQVDEPQAPAGLKDSDEGIFSWTYEREAGGRAFVFTGCHLHDSWAIEGYRRFITNGILWTAKVDVPTGGAPVALDPADLKLHLDSRPTKKK